MSSRALPSCALLLWFVLSCAGQNSSRPELRPYLDFAMRHEGDVARGKQLFNSEVKTMCVRCHSIDGTASKVGPDLGLIGDKFPRGELVAALLDPSANIAVGYGSTSVATKSGEELTGIIKQATDAYLELMRGDGTLVRIQRSDIATQHDNSQSLMPEGLQAGLSPQEFTDLIEYLVSLKQTESGLARDRGMPASIPQLARAVTLRPFIDESMQFPHSVAGTNGGVRTGLTWFGQLPGGTNEFLVVHQTGQIWLLEKSVAKDKKTVFADLSPGIFSQRGPNGLQSITFHPYFRQNRKYYLNHQILEAGKIVCTVMEREVTPDFRRDSGRPSRLIWKAPTTTQDHTGGGIQFGPDGFLYIGMGDTGPQRDPQGHGQDLTLHLGKILRIDVDHQESSHAYAIPADNPFRGRADALPEIWAYGLREPWRFSFDSLTGDLWVGDVGQDRIEEVDIVRRGENCGWNVYEGFEPFSQRYRKEGARYIPPVFAYGRKYGFSVTGGFVYRGDKHSSFYGVYICGDYASKKIWGLKQNDRRLEMVRQIATCPQSIASFGTDDHGNIYVVGYEGMLYSLDFNRAEFK